jgi:hypothetical protein
MLPPIITEQNQPEDFTPVMDEIDFLLSRLGLTWKSERVTTYAHRLLASVGYTPATPELARYALSHRQLTIFRDKLCQTLKQSSN